VGTILHASDKHVTLFACHRFARLASPTLQPAENEFNFTRFGFRSKTVVCKALRITACIR